MWRLFMKSWDNINVNTVTNRMDIQRICQITQRLMKMVKSRDICHICQKSFVTNQKMNRHIWYIHENIKDHKCEICNELFYREFDLKKHAQTIHGKMKPYGCSYCDKKFGVKISLYTHIQNVKINIEKKKLKCDFRRKRKMFFWRDESRDRYETEINKDWPWYLFMDLCLSSLFDFLSEV